MLGLGATSIVAAGIQPNWLFSLCVILFIFNLLTSTQDIATDGLAIEILTSSQVAGGNIAQVVGFKFGDILGGGLLSWLSDYISWSAIFIFLTFVYAVAVCVVNFCIQENDIQSTKLFSKPAENQPRKTNRNSSTEDNSSVLWDAAESSDGTGLQFEQETAGNQLRLIKHGSKSGVFWTKGHFTDVISVQGTVWILLYVLIYKLGEQGALNMMPLFLIDQGIPTAAVGLWTGVVGQAVSITGSVIGGAAISSGRCTAVRFLALLTMLKVGILTLEILLISSWSHHPTPIGFGTGIFLMLALLLVSGTVSTTAFTMMMQCSQQASPHCRASHYSLLATAEVLGKLLFSVVVGFIADVVGYQLAFGVFWILSLSVLPMFRFAPPSVMAASNNNENKNC